MLRWLTQEPRGLQACTMRPALAGVGAEGGWQGAGEGEGGEAAAEAAVGVWEVAEEETTPMGRQ